jgi:predicted nucleic acid-binding Zn finger protein
VAQTTLSPWPETTDGIFTGPHVDSGVTAVDEWERRLAEAGALTPEAVDRIIQLHDERGQRALDAVSENRVKEYRDFTVVVGRAEEYVVEDDGCTCKDAEYNLDPEDPEQLCWHAIAVRIARAIDETDEHDMWYSDVREFL